MRKSHIVIFVASFTVGLCCTYFVFVSRAQSARRECPIVYVDCPDMACGTDDRPCTFTATVKGIESDRELTYCWTVSKGKIKSGQGTPSLTVDVGGKVAYGVTAVVEVGGLGEGCTDNASCTTAIP